MAGEYIITASGKVFHPLEPTVEMISVEDIASALSKMTRWTGHTATGDEIYTVAQHAVYVSLQCSPEVALEGLHHDSSEAYLVDVARPLKNTPGFKEIYLYHEAKLTSVIYEAFGIPYAGTMHPSVEDADYRMLATEARDIMPTPETGMGAWNLDITRAYSYGVTNIWSPQQARRQFLMRHYDLMKRRDIGKG